MCKAYFDILNNVACTQRNYEAKKVRRYDVVSNDKLVSDIRRTLANHVNGDIPFGEALFHIETLIEQHHGV